MFPKAHAVAYVMMAFRIAWFKVHRPLAFYSAYFSVRAKGFDASCMIKGDKVCIDKIKELQMKDREKTITAAEKEMMTTLCRGVPRVLPPRLSPAFEPRWIFTDEGRERKILSDRERG